MDKIINGINIAFSTIPFLIYVYTNRSSCGGSMINVNTILTAGHCCIHNLPIYSKNHWSQEEYYVMDKRIHPNFDVNTFQNDICILKIETPYIIPHSFLDIQKENIVLYEQIGTPLTIIGVGTTHTNVKQGFVSILDPKEYPMIKPYIYPSMIIAGNFHDPNN